jgi:hypothetical protein
MMYFHIMTRGIEQFDPEIPCKGCIVKLLCSNPCKNWEKKINSWEEARLQKFITWYRRQMVEEG